MVKTKKRSRRSLEENRYYWGVVVAIIAARRKKSAEVVHEFIKYRFDVPSTAIISTVEFEDLMERVRQHYKNAWGIIIPLPRAAIDYCKDLGVKNVTLTRLERIK